MTRVDSATQVVVPLVRATSSMTGWASSYTQFAAHKVITVELEDGTRVSDAELAELSRGTVVERGASSATLRVTKADTPTAAAQLLARLPVVDLTIEDPPIERVIEDVFASPAAEEADGSVPRA